MTKQPKIKVHCIAILDRGIAPHAVLCADVKFPRSEPIRYVLLDDTLRDALSRLARDVGRKSYGFYGELPSEGAPLQVETHSFDARGRMLDDQPFGHRAERSWVNAGSRWVRASVIAPYVLADFAAWREQNPPHGGSIWAPSWNALVAVQAVALAAGTEWTVPQAEGDESTPIAVSQ